MTSKYQLQTMKRDLEIAAENARKQKLETDIVKFIQGYVMQTARTTENTRYEFIVSQHGHKRDNWSGNMLRDSSHFHPTVKTVSEVSDEVIEHLYALFPDSVIEYKEARTLSGQVSEVAIIVDWS